MKGHLQRRGRSSWRLKYDIPAGGKRATRYATIKATTQREAQAQATKILAAVHDGMHVDPSGVTVATFVTKWLDGVHGYGRKTLERYRQLARHQIIPHLGAVPLQRLRRAQIMDWHATLLKTGAVGGSPLSARSVGHAHKVLQRAIAHAVEGELLARNVAHGIRLPKAEAAEIEILKANEIKVALAALADHPLYPIVVLALGSGARRGELLALRWDDTDLIAGNMRIERSLEQTTAGLRFKPPKTKRSRRTIGLPQTVIETLRTHRRKQMEWRLAAGLGKITPDTLMFSRADGAPIPPDTLSRDWGVFVRAHKEIPLISFHALRHTHASALIASGLDVLSISRRLGHSSASVTLNIYGHLYTNTDDKAASVMEAALAGLGS